MSDHSIITQAIHTTTPQIAVIREAECIGCTKCIQACPVDAIIGASKQMHTVLSEVCIGCGLCVPPCPIDCIDLIPQPARPSLQQHQFAEQSQQRLERRELRLARQTHHQQTEPNLQRQTLAARQALIQAAVLRAKINK